MGKDSERDRMNASDMSEVEARNHINSRSLASFRASGQDGQSMLEIENMKLSEMVRIFEDSIESAENIRNACHQRHKLYSRILNERILFTQKLLADLNESEVFISDQKSRISEMELVIQNTKSQIESRTVESESLLEKLNGLGGELLVLQGKLRDLVDDLEKRQNLSEERVELISKMKELIEGARG